MSNDNMSFNAGEKYFLDFSFLFIFSVFFLILLCYALGVNLAFSAICQPIIMYYVIYRERVGGIALDKFWVANILRSDPRKFNEAINSHYENLYFSIAVVILLISTSVYKEGLFLNKKSDVSKSDVNDKIERQWH